VFDIEWPAYETEVEQLIDLGFRRFRLQNLGQLMLFAGKDGLQLECGYRLFTTNSQAASAWRELGLVAATLYVEDDRDNLAALLNRQVGMLLGATVYANLPMMVSRIPLRTMKADQPVISDRGDVYRVESRGGLTTVRPEQDFSLLGHIDELKRLGCRRFIVDLSHFKAGSADVRRILDALRRDLEVSGTSTFNYLQEML